MRRREQRTKRLVSAQQRVDAVEARRVVAVRAARGEDRRQVERVDAELLDVVEALLDPAQIAAEPLARGVRTAPSRKVVPRARNRPLGRVLPEPGGCEALGEDLVDDRRE